MDPDSGADLHEAPEPEICAICGEEHSCSVCTLIQIKIQVADRALPPKALLSLPECLAIQTMADENYSVVANSTIECGTKFGPLEATKSYDLDSYVELPLKIFDNEGDYYLNAYDQYECNWLMFVKAAQSIDEQNLMCYQEHSQIYYVTIKDVQKGDFLKVWYAPYYALKMTKKLLTQPFVDEQPLVEDVQTAVLDDLIKGQQKILQRESWTCKFCGHVETHVSLFAKHIRGHYADKQLSRTECEVCYKTFDTPVIYRRHFKIIHEKVAQARLKSKRTKKPPKPKTKDIPIGGPLLDNLLGDSMDNVGLLFPSVVGANNENVLLDVSLNLDNILNDNVKELDGFDDFQVNDDRETYVCDICLRSFAELHRFLQHLNKHTGKFTCQYCLKVFCRKENLDGHKCNTPNCVCETCGKLFKLRKHLRRHCESVHNKRFGCNSCNRHYYSQAALDEHNCAILPDDAKPKFACTLCDKTFLVKAYLTKHLKTHDDDKLKEKSERYVCEICAREFTSKYGFNHHKKTHSDRTFTCKACGKAFHRLDVFRTHLTYHKEKKTFEQRCHDCKQTFETFRSLALHRQTRHSVAPKNHTCDFCPKTFKERHQLAKHKQVTHTKTCPDCNKQFETQVSLKNHTYVHVNECFECPFCPAKMKLRSSLTRHIRKLHPEYSGYKTLYHKPWKKPVEDTEPDFEPYTNCESILDNFEDILGRDGNLMGTKEIPFEFDEDFGMDLGDTDEMQSKRDAQVCLSMPDLTEIEQEVTLGDNAYILEDGTIVEPNDKGELVMYVTNKPL